MTSFISICTAILLSLFTALTVSAKSPIISERDIYSPVQGTSGIVVAGEPIAAKIGLEVLKNGGNAVDAAVTIGFVMAVTLPQAGNIGGGGFMLVYSAETGEVIAIDYRERAPALAHRDLFLDSDGNPDNNLSRFSHISAGVPGTVSGLAMALKKYGTISLSKALKPAIKIAEEGLVVTPAFSNSIKSQAERLKRWPTTRELFFKPDGSFYEPGDRFTQKELARDINGNCRERGQSIL